MRNLIFVCAMTVMATTLTACSSSEPEENAFKAQTDAIGKAEDVNKLIDDQAAAQRKAIDEQSN